MTRIALVQSADEFPAAELPAVEEDLQALFQHVSGWTGKPRIPDTGKVFAVIARIPKLAHLLINVSDYMTGTLPWTTDRVDLRQLTIQTLNYHYKCDYNFQAHITPAANTGISAPMQAAIPYWRLSNMFDDEQRLVIEYTLAVVTGDVPQELFDRVSAHFGELGATEFTIAVAWWSFWAMICNATLPEHDFGFANH
jgi:alkylhydroperoxidase family enzyme